MDPVLPPRALPIQHDVDAMIRALGGYWRILAQTTRLLEECGEVAEATTVPQLVDECGDIVIVTTSIANQMGIALGGYYQAVGLPFTLTVPPAKRGADPIPGLFITAGRIARSVNALAGDKPMRAEAVPPDLGLAIAEIHHQAAAIAAVSRTPFLASIGTKLANIRVHDAGRFDNVVTLQSTPPAPVLTLSR